MIRIGVTAGCPAGIGPDVVASALARADLDDSQMTCVFFGPPELLLQGAKLAGVSAERVEGGRVRLTEDGPERLVEVEEHTPLRVPDGPYGPVDEAALTFQRDALLAAARAAPEGRVDAIVTGPIRKQALQDVEGRAFPGQTELLHHTCTPTTTSRSCASRAARSCSASRRCTFRCAR